MSSQNPRSQLIAFGLLGDGSVCLGDVGRGLPQRIGAGGLPRAACWEGKLLGQSPHAQGCASLDLAWPESWLAKSTWETLPSENPVVWGLSTRWHVPGDNELQYLMGSRSLRTIPTFSIVVTSKPKAFCMSQKQMVYFGALLNSRTIFNVSPLRLLGSESSAGRPTLG